MIEWVESYVGKDSILVMPIVMWMAQLMTYAFVGVLFTAVDIFRTPHALHTWRIQTALYDVNGTERQPSLARTLWRVATAFVCILPTLVFLQFLTRSLGLGIPTHAVTPPVWRFALDGVLIVLLAELGFYAAHRTLHAIPWLYQNIHKQHHEFKVTVAIAATAAHPLEVVFGNTIPIQIWPFLLGSHPYLVVIGSVVGTLSTMYDHCGYWIFGDSKWTIQPFFHDWHHEKSSGNFGFLGLCDYLLGTDASWRREYRMRKVELLKRAAGMKVH